MPNYVLLTVPEAGKTERYDALGGKTFQFGFDPADAQITRESLDMVIAVNQGGKISLDGLYTPNALDLPKFVVPQGTLSTPEFINEYDAPQFDPAPIAPMNTVELVFEVNEANFTDGSDPKQDPVSHTLVLPEGHTVDTTVDWTSQGNDVFVRNLPDAKGYLSYNTDTNAITFTLTDLVQHDGKGADVAEFLTGITLNGPSGPYTVNATIKVTDDVPTAELAPYDNQGTVAYPGDLDVIECSGGKYEGYWNVKPGADGLRETTLTVYVPGKGSVSNVIDTSSGYQEIALELAGPPPLALGTITFFDNGDFEFKPAEPLQTVLTFTLSAVDGDGDISSDSFQLGVIDGESGCNFPFLTPDNAFDEANLPGVGTKPGAGPVEQPIDLPADWEVDYSGWDDNGDGTWSKSGDAGTLTYDPASNELKYTLEEGLHHPKDADLADDVIDITLIYTGPQHYDTCDISVVVPIKDDSPTISVTAPDEPGVSGTPIEGTYEVHYGADGPADDDPLVVKITYEGETKVFPLDPNNPTEIIFGTDKIGDFAIQPGDNTYTFTPVPNSEGSFTFVFGATDQEGDYVESTGDEIEIEFYTPVAPDPIFGGLFDEANLADGTASDPSALSQNIAIPAGYTLLTTGWDTGDNVVFTKDLGPGELEYDSSSKTLKYTLKDVADHPVSGQRDTDDFEVDIKVQDERGNELPTKIWITVQDDMPEVSLSTPAGQHYAGFPIEGAFDVKFGADGEAALKLYVTANNANEVYDVVLGQEIAISVGGIEGTITFGQPDASHYTFTPAPNSTGSVSFILEATDGDGDIIRSSDSGNLIDFIEPVGPNPINLGEFDEANLANGTNADPAALVKIIPIEPGFRLDTNGWTPEGGNLTKELGAGKLIFDPSSGELKYEMTGVLAHPDPSGQDVLPVTGELVFVDAGGNEFKTPVAFTVTDDIPEVSMSAPAGPGQTGFPISGDVDYQFGADGPSTTAPSLVLLASANGADESYTLTVGTPVTISVGGVEGEFVLNANNTYTFTPKANQPGSLSVVLQATDGDGDVVKSDSGIVITFEKPVDPIPGPLVPDSDYDEANFINGTNPNTPELTQNIALPAGFEVVTSSGWDRDNAGVFEKDCANGVLRYDSAANTLVFELTDPYAHPDAGRDSLSDIVGQIVLKDAGGNTYAKDIEITVLDDIPIVTPDVGAHDLTNIDALVAGDLDIRAGADGTDNDTATEYSFVIKYQYGSLTPEMDDIVVLKDGTVTEHRTQAGLMKFWYDNTTGKIEYSYQAVAGLEGFVDVVSFTQVDREGDVGSNNINFTYKETIGGVNLAVDEAAIPGLGSSQYISDDDSASYQLDLTQILNNAQISWELPAGNFFADGNNDGQYDKVIWVANGNRLEGYADNELAILVEAKLDANGFTGEIESTLYKPFQHSGINVPGDNMDLKIGLNQSNGVQSVKLDVNVKIYDDSPLRDHPDARPIIDVDKAGHPAESVYLVLDCSGSISRAEGNAAVAAIKALAQSYIDNGIDAVFSLVGFNKAATTYADHVTAQTLIQNLSWSSIYSCGTTNFEVGLARAMDLMDAGRTSSAYDGWHQTMYFISDGAMNKGDKKLTAWRDYRDSRGDELDVNAICVEKCKVSATKYNNMVLVTGDPDDYYHVTDYNALLDQLVSLVHTEASGNLLGNISGADYTTLDYIQDSDGQWHSIPREGLTLNLGDGIKLTIHQNGDYTVDSGRINGDIHKELGLKFVDADGDSLEVKTDLVIRDVRPTAYDNVSALEPYGAANGLNGHTVNGSGKLHCLCASSIPGIPEYSQTLLHCKGKATLYTASKYGAAALEALCGGQAGVQQLFQDMGLAYQKYGGNAIVAVDVQDSGGTIAFNWAFKPGCSKTNWDAAFWILKDSSGNIVKAGPMWQHGNGKWASGVTYVDLPDAYDKYTLYIVQQELGSCSSCPNSKMYLKDIVYFADDQLRSTGNVLTDGSPDGLVDTYGVNDYLAGVWYDGVYYAIAGSQITIDCDQGRLVIDKNGNYTYLSDKNVSDNVVEDFTYVLRSADGKEATADLHIRSSDRLINGTANDDVIDNTANSYRDGDVIQAGDGNDTVYGGDGDEFIYGGAGNDLIHGGDGDDVIQGGAGNDVIYGDDGNDLIYGGDGNDQLYGGAGNDTLYGNTGNDYLNGGDGDDLLYGGSGINYLTGGEGADTFAWGQKDLGGLDVITDFDYTEGDRLSFSDLLSAGQTLDQYVSNLTISESDRTFSFDLSNGALTKVVEIHFQDGDSNFNDAVADYNAATNPIDELAALQALLNSITA